MIYIYSPFSRLVGQLFENVSKSLNFWCHIVKKWRKISFENAILMTTLLVVITLWLPYYILRFSSTCVKIRADSKKINGLQCWNPICCRIRNITTAHHRFRAAFFYNSTFQRWSELSCSALNNADSGRNQRRWVLKQCCSLSFLNALWILWISTERRWKTWNFWKTDFQRWSFLGLQSR